MRRICFATNNKHKLEEVRLLTQGQFEIVSLKDIGCTDEIPETSDTIEGNSFLKAQFVKKKYNIDCFADDSGLEVMALQGAPGVYSARYAGEHKSDSDNLNLLLKNLVGLENREAQFKTVITLVLATSSFQFKGIVKGKIVDQPIGEAGFGYDPIFVPEGYTQTFAQMSTREKGQISHRGIATRQLVEFLKSWGSL